MIGVPFLASRSDLTMDAVGDSERWSGCEVPVRQIDNNTPRPGMKHRGVSAGEEGAGSFSNTGTQAHCNYRCSRLVPSLLGYGCYTDHLGPGSWKSSRR
jgi:hypothetical protein